MRTIVLSISVLAFLAMGCNTGSDLALQVNGTLSNNPERQTVYLDLVELDGVAPRTLDTVII